MSGLDRVIEVDAAQRTAEVQGMCTYEDLVEATLPHGLIPYVVPQLKTITLGGAVTGLGIESTSFRNGLPHESVLEMDVFTGAGEVVTDPARASKTCSTPSPTPTARSATPPGSGSGSRRCPTASSCATCASTMPGCWPRPSPRSSTPGSTTGSRSTAWTASPSSRGSTTSPWPAGCRPSDRASARAATGSRQTSDYTGQQVYYRSIQQRETDLLTMHDYLWRWDTDWFWCSGAFGVQNPTDPPAVAASATGARTSTTG